MSGGGEDSTSQGERWGCGSNDDESGGGEDSASQGERLIMMMRVVGVKTVQAKVRGGW
jgi:hypothetical protein